MGGYLRIINQKLMWAQGELTGSCFQVLLHAGDFTNMGELAQATA